MQVKVIQITTDAGGDFVGTLVVKTPAKLHAAQWVDGDLADGVDAELVCTQFAPRDDVQQTLLDLTDADNDAFYYPRVTGDTAAGVEIADAYAAPVVHGVLTLTVSGGGDTNTGALWLYLDE
jgi:hypothetical protein